MVEKTNQKLIKIKISAELESLEQIRKKFNGIESGNILQFCDGNAELKLLTADNVLSFGGGATVELLLSFSIGVASGVVGNLIYNALCSGIKKLEINGRRTRITEENIIQTIEIIKNLVLLSEENSHSAENSDEHK